MPASALLPSMALLTIQARSRQMVCLDCLGMPRRGQVGSMAAVLNSWFPECDGGASLSASYKKYLEHQKEVDERLILDNHLILSRISSIYLRISGCWKIQVQCFAM